MRVSSTKNTAMSSGYVGNGSHSLAGKIFPPENVTISDKFRKHTELKRSSLLQENEMLPFLTVRIDLYTPRSQCRPFSLPVSSLWVKGKQRDSGNEAEVYCSCEISEMTAKLVKLLNTCESTLQAGNMRSTYLTEFMVPSRRFIIWLDEDDGSEREILKIPKQL